MTFSRQPALIILCLNFLFLIQSPLRAQTVKPDSLDRRFLDSLMNEVANLSSSQRDSLKMAIMGLFSIEELLVADKLQDSLFGQGRIRNELLSTTVRDMPGITVNLSLPDDWKNIDPFAKESMNPKNVELKIDFGVPKTSKLFEILSRAKPPVIILAVILQALLL